ncbi:MAG: isoprenylcysteine carboxylmethyltransferase family protein [Pseudomonadota bacterium]
MQAKIPPPVLAALIAAAMYGVSRSPWALPFDTGFNGWISSALLLAGAVVAALGIIQFRRHKTTVDPLHPDKASTLVTSGIYRVTRNPMYVGLVLILLGVGVRFDSLAALVVALGFVPLITVLQIRAEEAAMRDLFGSDFDAYAATVRRWL